MLSSTPRLDVSPESCSDVETLIRKRRGIKPVRKDFYNEEIFKINRATIDQTFNVNHKILCRIFSQRRVNNCLRIEPNDRSSGYIETRN